MNHLTEEQKATNRRIIKRLRLNSKKMDLEHEVHMLKSRLYDGVASCDIDCDYCEKQIELKGNDIKKEIKDLEDQIDKTLEEYGKE